MNVRDASMNNKPLKILIVDDKAEALRLLEMLLVNAGHTIVSAADGKEALEKLHSEEFGMIISDILMPVIDGFQLCKAVKGDETLSGIPFVFYTATYTDEKDEQFAMKLGAEAFMRKPMEPDKLMSILQGVIKDAEKGEASPKQTASVDEMDCFKLYNQRLVEKLEHKMLVLEKEVTKREQVEEELKQSHETLAATMTKTVGALATAIELRDPYTAGHQRQVAALAYAIAQELNISEKQIEGVHMAALIHDIGKIAVPSEILSKPAPLSETEFALVKVHSQVGYEILRGIDFETPIAKIILQHHERMDGSGYPNQLEGDDILLEARIIAVADTVEAMASHRPYRAALGIDKACDEISRNKGVKYDAEVVEACLKLFTEDRFKLEP